MLSRDFILAGDATFTIQVPPGTHKADGELAEPHYTYRVEKVEASDKWPEAYFIRCLTGPDNTSDYVYAGGLDLFTGQLVRTAKSAFPATSFRIRLLNRVLARVWTDDHQSYEQYGYRLHHEGRCGRCGRKLTVPSSIESGIGPECAKQLAGA